MVCVFFFVEAISQRGCCWLVDDPQHFEASNFAGVFCGLTLGVVEVCRNGDNRLCHFFAKIASAVSFILPRMNAEIWQGSTFSPLASTHASPLPPS